ncbi:hypothetical protein HT031_001919 [Scenedesmus sp. PABB004]|nr:hypothetical protein HT031_001919 [Scenedesmus sp. PABB004]
MRLAHRDGDAPPSTGRRARRASSQSAPQQPDTPEVQQQQQQQQQQQLTATDAPGHVRSDPAASCGRAALFPVLEQPPPASRKRPLETADAAGALAAGSSAAAAARLGASGGAIGADGPGAGSAFSGGSRLTPTGRLVARKSLGSPHGPLPLAAWAWTPSPGALGAGGPGAGGAASGGSQHTRRLQVHARKSCGTPHGPLPLAARTPGDAGAGGAQQPTSPGGASDTGGGGAWFSPSEGHGAALAAASSAVTPAEQQQGRQQDDDSEPAAWHDAREVVEHEQEEGRGPHDQERNGDALAVQPPQQLQAGGPGARLRRLQLAQHAAAQWRARPEQGAIELARVAARRVHGASEAEAAAPARGAAGLTRDDLKGEALWACAAVLLQALEEQDGAAPPALQHGLARSLLRRVCAGACVNGAALCDTAAALCTAVGVTAPGPGGRLVLA